MQSKRGRQFIEALVNNPRARPQDIMPGGRRLHSKSGSRSGSGSGSRRRRAQASDSLPTPCIEILQEERKVIGSAEEVMHVIKHRVAEPRPRNEGRSVVLQ